MKREVLTKFFTAISELVSVGLLVVENKKALVSHSDIANVAMVYATGELDVADGSYGVEFNRILTAVKAGEKDVKLSLGKETHVISYGKTKHNMPSIVISTLPTARPRIFETIPFQCEMELDKDEFVSIVSTIEKNVNPQQNEFVKIMLQYDGKVLTIRTADDPRDFVERTFELISVEKGSGEKFTSFYPFDYMRIFAKAFKELDCKTIKLCFGNDLPAYMAGKDSSTGIVVEYSLAPRIDQE